ncbi:MAG: putative lipid II flippase FtsW [Acidobacteriota bacterium]
MTQRYDRVLISTVLALLGFGTIMVFSVSSVVSGDTGVFTRQLLLTALGIVVMLLVMQIDYHVYGRRGVMITLLAMTYLLLLLALVSPEVKGVHRWIVLGRFRFQPSELAKLVVILFTSYSLACRKEDLCSLWRGLLPCLSVIGSIALLILRGPDLGTAVCVAVNAGFLLYVGGIKYRHLAALAVAATLAFYLLVWRVPYRQDRIMAFVNPDQSPLGISYQIRQSLIAVGSGGWTGTGFAQSKQKLSFLPESHTDFIFSILGEELGLLGCCAVLALLLMFFWRGVRIALRADSPLGTLVGLGVVGMIIFQSLINISVVLSLLPTKGIPLPFISVGGSSLLVMLTGVGILLNISSQGSSQGVEKGWLRLGSE